MKKIEKIAKKLKAKFIDPPKYIGLWRKINTSGVLEFKEFILVFFERTENAVLIYRNQHQFIQITSSGIVNIESIGVSRSIRTLNFEDWENIVKIINAVKNYVKETS